MVLAISNNCQLRCRNEKLAIKVLAESTLAAQDGCIYYLAAAASLQQWGQAALAFLVLRRSERGLSAAQLCEAVESTLEGSFRVSIYCLCICRGQQHHRPWCSDQHTAEACIGWYCPNEHARRCKMQTCPMVPESGLSRALVCHLSSCVT